MPRATVASQKYCGRHVVEKMEVRDMIEEQIGKQPQCGFELLKS
jgi:hypothetical protein